MRETDRTEAELGKFCRVPRRGSLALAASVSCSAWLGSPGMAWSLGMAIGVAAAFGHSLVSSQRGRELGDGIARACHWLLAGTGLAIGWHSVRPRHGPRMGRGHGARRGPRHGMALSKALAWRSAQQRHSAGSRVYSHTCKLEMAARGTKAAAGGGLAALAPSGSLSGSLALGNTSSGRSAFGVAWHSSRLGFRRGLA
jgi:hypothetical protein